MASLPKPNGAYGQQKTPHLRGFLIGANGSGWLSNAVFGRLANVPQTSYRPSDQGFRSTRPDVCHHGRLCVTRYAEPVSYGRVAAPAFRARCGSGRLATDSEPQHVREDSAEPERTDARDDGYRWIPAEQFGHAAGVSRRVRLVQFARPQCGRYHAGWRWGDTPTVSLEGGSPRSPRRSSRLPVGSRCRGASAHARRLG